MAIIYQALRDMCPPCAPRDSADGGLSDTKLLCQIDLTRAERMALADGPDRVVSQFRHARPLTPQHDISSFGDHVSNIVSLSPDEQVRRSDAGRVVTSVKNFIGVGQRPALDVVDKPSDEVADAVSFDSRVAIDARPLPFPATFRLWGNGYARQDVFEDGLARQRSVGHGQEYTR